MHEEVLSAFATNPGAYLVAMLWLRHSIELRSVHLLFARKWNRDRLAAGPWPYSKALRDDFFQTMATARQKADKQIFKGQGASGTERKLYEKASSVAAHVDSAFIFHSDFEQILIFRLQRSFVRRRQ